MRLINLLLVFLLSTSMAFGQTETLTVYTYRSFVSEWGAGPSVKKLFEQQCRCEINFVALDDGVSLRQCIE